MAKTPDAKIHQEAAVKAHRAQAAMAKEIQAIMAEVGARQWQIVIEEDPMLPGAAQQERQFRDNAERQRAEADKMHELAATDPATMKAHMLVNLRGNLPYYEAQMYGAIDAEEHAEAYGDNSGQQPALVAKAALQALQEAIAKLEES